MDKISLSTKQIIPIQRRQSKFIDNMILISQYKVRVWYKEDLRWIVNNPDGDWMQNSCNTKKMLSLIPESKERISFNLKTERRYHKSMATVKRDGSSKSKK